MWTKDIRRRMQAVGLLMPDEELIPAGPFGQLPIVPRPRLSVLDLESEMSVTENPIKLDVPVYDGEATEAQLDSEWQRKWDEFYKREEEERNRADDDGMAQPSLDDEYMVAPKPELECHRSELKIFTPYRYCLMNGLYGSTHRDNDDIAHDWTDEGDTYLQDIQDEKKYPRFVQDFYHELPYLHDSRVEMLGRYGDEINDLTLFRLYPATNDDAVELEISAAWMSTKIVLPKELRTKKEDPNNFLYEEFQRCDLAGNHLNFYFYTSDGTEYGFEGVDKIEWRRIPNQKPVVIDVPVVRKEVKKATRLFTCFFSIQEKSAVFQVKSADWSTVWEDIQKETCRRLRNSASIVWTPFIESYKNNRNVYSGHATIDGSQVEIIIVNTKRGKPPGIEELES